MCRWALQAGELGETDQAIETLEEARVDQRSRKATIDLMELYEQSERYADLVALLLAEADDASPSAWKQVRLDGVSRAYKTPWVLDRQVTLRDYVGPIRQLIITDLGHEEPTILLTNQLKRSAKKLIERYAHRMLIENGIADGIDFFHMDALSSAVAMKVNCDLQLTLMASSLYRLLGARLGRGYERAKSRHIFRDFINATAQITIEEHDLVVR